MRFEEILCVARRDYPELKFLVGKRFKYRPPRTIYYVAGDVWSGASGFLDGASGRRAEQNYDILEFLHEVGHALIGKNDYRTDVERLKIERAAWEEARKLCATYGVDYDEEFVEAELDTYRDWLEQRSRCKECGLVRYQDKRGEYHCPQCENFGVSKIG